MSQVNDERIFITMGEFMRNASETLDGIEKNCLTMVLTRFGRPVAMIVPFSAAKTPAAVADEAARVIWAGLGDVERQVLAAAGRAGAWVPADYIGTPAEFNRAMFELEAGELLKRSQGSYRLTETGKRVAACGG